MKSRKWKRIWKSSFLVFILWITASFSVFAAPFIVNVTEEMREEDEFFLEIPEISKWESGTGFAMDENGIYLYSQWAYNPESKQYTYFDSEGHVVEYMEDNPLELSKNQGLGKLTIKVSITEASDQSIWIYAYNKTSHILYQFEKKLDTESMTIFLPVDDYENVFVSADGLVLNGLKYPQTFSVSKDTTNEINILLESVETDTPLVAPTTEAENNVNPSKVINENIKESETLNISKDDTETIPSESKVSSLFDFNINGEQENSDSSSTTNLSSLLFGLGIVVLGMILIIILMVRKKS